MIEFFLARKKTLIIIIFFIVIGSSYFYFYGKENNAEKAMIPIVESGVQEQKKPEETGRKQNESGGIEKKQEKRIVVDVKGAVAHPGVYTLHGEARMFEAIGMAGGLLPEADDKQVNGAQLLQDGALLYIPHKGEQAAEASYKQGASPGVPAGSDSGQIRVDINHAASEQLQTIPGIGPGKAAAIIQYREEKGLFRTIEDITNVSGIGAKTFEKIKPHIVAK